MATLVVGCGYVGLRLAGQLAGRGGRVYGARRGIPDPAAFEEAGVIPLELDVTRPSTLERVPSGIRRVVNAVSSSRGGPGVYREVYLEGTRALIGRLGGIERYLHVGSTSVYGQSDGSWVDEDSERSPRTEGSRILVETEDLLLEAWRREGFPAVLARVSGIYGPGRGHLLARYLEGRAVLHRGGARHLNMIHVEDLVDLLEGLLDKGAPGEAYNLSDGAPVTQREFLEWLARELGGPLPPSSGEEPAGKRAPTDKRVSSRKACELTGHRFRYPSWRQGYAGPVALALQARLRAERAGGTAQ